MQEGENLRKEIDWRFVMKMVIVGVFFLFILIITFERKAFQPMEEQVKQNDHVKTDVRRPVRMKLMVMNTITLFFFLMSVQEYRLNEIMAPMGVDPDKIPTSCWIQQQIYYWFVILCCLLIVFYNFIIHFLVLTKASSTNVFSAKKDTVVKYAEYINKKQNAFKNGGAVVEMYPYALEFVVSVLLAFLSGFFYVMFVLINYNIIDNNMFKSCFHPRNTARFYDPFAGKKTEEINKK